MKWLAVLALAACGSGRGGEPLPMADAPGNTPPPALPTWMLEDIQPESPRAGQTYGLQTFGGRIVVVTLVEGY